MGRKTTLCWGVADAWGLVAVAASEAGRRVGVSSALGWLAGLAARVGPACARSRAACGAGCCRAQARLAVRSRELGRLRAEQAGPAAGLLLFFSFFYFIFLLLCLNLNVI